MANWRSFLSFCSWNKALLAFVQAGFPLYRLVTLCTGWSPFVQAGLALYRWQSQVCFPVALKKWNIVLPGKSNEGEKTCYELLSADNSVQCNSDLPAQKNVFETIIWHQWRCFMFSKIFFFCVIWSWNCLIHLVSWTCKNSLCYFRSCAGWSNNGIKRCVMYGSTADMSIKISFYLSPWHSFILPSTFSIISCYILGLTQKQSKTLSEHLIYIWLAETIC